MSAIFSKRTSKTGVGLKNSMLLKTGIVGTIVAAICCFTPFLVLLLGAIGLSFLTGYLDFILLPALGFLIALTGYALWKPTLF